MTPVPTSSGDNSFEIELSVLRNVDSSIFSTMHFVPTTHPCERDTERDTHADGRPAGAKFHGYIVMSNLRLQ